MYTFEFTLGCLVIKIRATSKEEAENKFLQMLIDETSKK